MAIVGSGIMAQSLTSDLGIQLLINSFSTICALFVLISLLSQISGAHFNPVVSLYIRFIGKISNKDLLSYLLAQILGSSLGVIVGNLMFNKPAIDIASTSRTGAGRFIAEIVATIGLLSIVAWKSDKAAVLVPAWIGSAFFFTSSTSFANPAVTISRTLSDTFTGIAPGSIIQFLVAQVLALLLFVTLQKFVKVS
jgi:glycerol uptake facilitator-like aquaporin